jgi:riboflavin kinase/FMN adenylyltransferase
MNVYRSLAEVPADFGPCALTIGNFDGLHVGHRQILRRVVAVARERGWKASVLTFHPHPARVLAPERAPRLLTEPEPRIDLIREEGIDQILILPFTHELARLTPDEFVRELVLARLGARGILVGHNFRFGNKQSGDVGVLAELGRKLGFDVEAIPAVSCRGRLVSSSAIREAILSGRVDWAARLLQRPYGVEGDVVKGHGVGAKQTVPTLNLDTQAEVIPSRGVYITRTQELVADPHPRRWTSITNIGYRPTFGSEHELSIETFLLDSLVGPTPARIRVEFLRRVRDERRFESPEALKSQILKDVHVAQSYFRRLKSWGRRPVTRV